MAAVTGFSILKNVHIKLEEPDKKLLFPISSNVLENIIY
jgi:hypothetical protein